MYGIETPPQSYTLQASLSASSAGGTIVTPHHPITCTGPLRYYEDGSAGCDHASVPGDDPRMKQCVTHSIAILLLELAVERYR